MNIKRTPTETIYARLRALGAEDHDLAVRAVAASTFAEMMSLSGDRARLGRTIEQYFKELHRRGKTDREIVDIVYREPARG